MSGWKSGGELVKRLPLWSGAVDARTLDVHLPVGLNGERPPWTVVVFAGGGYGMRSWHEGPGTVQWLAMNGVAAVDVPYRVASEVSGTLHPAPLRDGCRAVRVVRDHAGELGLDPAKIAVLGYSAGGHAAGSVMLLHAESGPGDDLAAGTSARPDACAMIYPVVSMVPPCHEGSAANLLGANAAVGDRRTLSLQTRVDAAPPPLFVVHAQDDGAVPLSGALELCSACRARGGAVESHVFPRGGHGFGLGLDRGAVSAWPAMLLSWLAAL